MIILARRRAIDQLRASSCHLQCLKAARASVGAAFVQAVVAQIASAKCRAIELAFFASRTHFEVMEALKVSVGILQTRLRHRLRKREGARSGEARKQKNL